MTSDDPAIRRLLDEQEIRAVLTRLARGTDRRDPELIRSCYHADGFDDHGAFRGTPAEFAEWVPQTLSIFECTMHVLGNIQIEIDEGRTRAWTETYCTAHHIFPQNGEEGVGDARDAVMGLRYIDRFERRTDGAWRIAKRVCAYEYAHVVVPSEVWGLAPPYVRGSAGPQDPSYARD